MFLITMAGLSTRFFKAGFTEPKFKISLFGKSVFHHSLRSFQNYFESDLFLFAIREDHGSVEFVRQEALTLGIKNFKIVIIDHPTNGQAETAHIALKGECENEPIFIFNIDTFLLDYQKPDFINQCDGYLETFSEQGQNWSFVEAGPNNSVLRTTEKERISELCSDGLYYFKSKNIFDLAYQEAISKNQKSKGEFYVAPLYNFLISCSLDVRYTHIPRNKIALCGTPQELQHLQSQGHIFQ